MASNSREAAFYEGGYRQAVFAPFKFGVSCFLFVAVTLLAAWVAQHIVVFLVWGGDSSPLEEVLRKDAWLAATGMGLAPFSSHAIDAAQGLYQWLFVHSNVEFIVTATPDSLTSIDRGIQKLFHAVFPAIQVFFVGTKLYALRLMLALSATPLLAIAYAVGMVDGLVERSIRRYSGGRESSSLYHRAKYLIAGSVGVTTVGYLCLPLSVSLPSIAMPLAVITCGLSRVQWKYYKKYL
ncbi:MAG: DUF4400 domain-containing protein [Betaproteobacteria bacterium]|nr:DUF4400 domain-containing protein [Betaproteobacteria bacterium]